MHEPGHASGALIFPTLFRQLPPAVRNLDAIERDELAIDTAAEWYALQRGSGKQQGRLAVLNDLSVLRVQFDAIPRIVEDIDIRNSRFSGAALQKIRYLLRQDRQTEGQLQFIIDTLAKTHVPDIEFDVYKCELLVGDFLYTPPSERLRPKPQMLTKRTIDDDERIRKQVARSVRRMFDRRRVEEFVDRILAGRGSVSIEEVPVETDEE